MSKISLQMFTMREHTKTISDLADTVGKLSDIGFENLQYTIPKTFDAKEVKRIFDANKIKNDSVFCSCMELEENAKATLEQCELFGTDHIRIESIPTSLTTTASGYKMFAHYLNEVGEAYKKAGAKILYHFHAFEFKRFGDKTGIEILLDETDPEVIALNPDTHWIHSGGKDICKFLEKYKDRYDYIHTKDFAIGNMGSAWEARPIEFAPVGEGNLEWEPIISLCKSLGVKIFAIEQDDCYGKDEFDCVRTSFNNLKKLGVDEI